MRSAYVHGWTESRNSRRVEEIIVRASLYRHYDVPLNCSGAEKAVYFYSLPNAFVHSLRGSGWLIALADGDLG